jgi:hypothetical protein
VNAQGLKTLAGALQQPIYWAGVRPGYRLELTRESDGRVFVRYLPPSAAIGTKRPFITVGTYFLAGAYSLTQSAAARPGAVRVAIPEGVAFYSRKAPTSIYLAYPGSDVQVEVFDPWAPGARKLVASGAVVAVAASRPSSVQGLTAPPQGLTLTALRNFAKRVGHPVYWVGPRPDTTYEVTQAIDGQIYVRYLPLGKPVGTKEPFLTIGTYPLPNALGATRGRAEAAGSVRVPAASGATAFYARGRSTNVYEAFPGVEYQIEVYDPTPRGAARLVSAGKVVTV